MIRMTDRSRGERKKLSEEKKEENEVISMKRETQQQVMDDTGFIQFTENWTQFTLP